MDSDILFEVKILFGKEKVLLSTLTPETSSFKTILNSPTKPFSVSSNGITKPG